MSDSAAHMIRADEVTLPRRAAESHKGDYGKLLIIGGSVGYTGAPTLCARGAVCAGAGLVRLGVPEPIYQITAVKNDEAMPFPLPADADGRLSAGAIPAIDAALEQCTVCAVGPGLGRSEGVRAAVRHILGACSVPLVLDADALWALSDDPAVLRTAGCTAVLTPHDGEFARLGGRVSDDRTADAVRFARTYGCVLVLKGHRTLIAWPDGELLQTPHGNPGMAKGGSGDVLTGVLAAMLGQLSERRAVSTGVFLHSYAGDLACAHLGEYAMTASDLIAHLSEASQRMHADACGTEDAV